MGDVIKKMFIGFNKDKRPLRLHEDIRSRHMHVIGSTGTGKSKFLEWMIRGDIQNGNGLCLIDPHGDLYEAVLAWCAYNNYLTTRNIVLLNPSSGDFVTGFNPFARAAVGNISTQVNRRIKVTLKAWGVERGDQTPTLERWLRCIYTILIEKDLSLVESQYLLDFRQAEVLKYLTRDTAFPLIASEWEEALALQTAKQFRDEFLSTKNRFYRLLNNQHLMHFMGLEDHNLDLTDIMGNGKILLVNLKESDDLDEDTARLFGTLLTNQLFEVAKRRERDGLDKAVRPFYLYLDEFQKFATPDIEYILAQGRKMGLHLVLSHQNLSQVASEMDLGSLLTNTRTKVVFGGINRSDATAMVEEMFVDQLDYEEIKEAVAQTKFWPVYDRDEVRTVASSTSDSFGHSSGIGVGTMSGSVHGQITPEGMFAPETSTQSFSAGTSASSINIDSDAHTMSEMEAVADIPIYRPIPFKESSSVYTLEEQIHRMGDALKAQWARHCFIKIGDEKTQPMLVPRVKQPDLSRTTAMKYNRVLMERSPYSLPISEAQKQIEQRHRRLLEAAKKESRESRNYPEDNSFIEQ